VTPVTSDLTIVLVHGAFVDGSGWRGVHDLLVDDGYQVAVVQNPGASVHDDVVATRLVIDGRPGRVLLVGHSYGGSVITESGTHPRVAGLVYVCAFAPDQGESVNQLMAEFPAEAPRMTPLPTRHGFIFQDADRFHRSFGADLPADLAAFMAHAQAPWGAEAAAAPVTGAAWRTRPSWYLVATEDRAIPPASQRAMAARAGSEVTELAATHAVYIAQPDQVADLIKRAAQQLA
jgi:pimeloyl-ACP methyl ester carboxylesterase